MQDIKYPLLPAFWIDGTQRNTGAPDTFKIPDEYARSGAAVGDFVKIGVESPERGGERFWVEIMHRIDDGRYVGRVDNDLEEGWGFNCDDHVMFEARHILATQ